MSVVSAICDRINKVDGYVLRSSLYPLNFDGKRYLVRSPSAILRHSKARFASICEFKGLKRSRVPCAVAKHN